ncbi:amino acid adenylation domain protein [Xenorhabdus beddingii]|uniref:Amino acid adenylation domain protein n=1 Tax=Xenorhabdus beddingii TaxID=40578 RepID=A0A1Y2ST53_9GAMM|nr:non-ribosomal peptide synthetase [Xenorhabdus beddingii]OTA21557.1 amino acid adenylation domain protein [Xenorhabdus beddingii]
MKSKKTIHSLFMAQKIKTPHAVALRSNNSSINYEELDNRSTELACYLIKQGVNTGDKIGVYLHKGVSLVVSLLGILKAGACYVPLDPSYPQERLLYIVRHASIRFIMTSPTLADKISVDDDKKIDITALHLNASSHFSLPEVDDDSLCYVMYTSGSTGQPKGVMIRHRTVVNYLWWMQDAFGIAQRDVVLNQTTFSFDVSVWEIFWPLITGASCALISDDIKYDPHQVINFIQQHHVTVVQFVPTALRTIVAAQKLQACSELQHIFSGGEALDQKLVDDLAAQFTGQIHNLYGPTETTIYACHWLCQPGADATIVPIGTPIPHVRAYVLDEQLNELSPGKAGELYLAGDILAQGYINEPEKTRNSFVTEPFVTDTPSLMYKTGDIVRAREDGVLEFLGRVDNQVKLRGYRVELNEIEVVLRNYSRLSDAVVILEENDESKLLEIVAFYTVKENETVQELELKEYLYNILPFYMIPSYLIEQAFIPTLPNGKVDKTSLHHNFKKNLRHTAKNIVPPTSNIETEIIKIWEQVLNNKNLSIHENFFDAGGNSLLMSKAHREIKKNLDISVSIMDLYQYPTVKALSTYLAEKGLKSTSSNKSDKADNKSNGVTTHE